MAAAAQSPDDFFQKWENRLKKQNVRLPKISSNPRDYAAGSTEDVKFVKDMLKTIAKPFVSASESITIRNWCAKNACFICLGANDEYLLWCIIDDRHKCVAKLTKKMATILTTNDFCLHYVHYIILLNRLDYYMYKSEFQFSLDTILTHPPFRMRGEGNFIFSGILYHEAFAAVSEMGVFD